MLDWLPKISTFSATLRMALEATDPSDRVERLARLARHQLGFLETVQIDRALGEVTKPQADFPCIRLAVMASSTVDHLIPAIRVGALRRRLLLNVYTGAFGQQRQELLDPDSRLHNFSPHAILFSFAEHESVGGVPLAATRSEAEEALDKSVADLSVLWRKARDDLKAIVIQETCLNVSDPIFGSYDRLVPGAPSQLVSVFNERLAEAAARDSVLLLDIARLGERDGIDEWFDAARFLQAKITVSQHAASLYGDMVARLIAAQRGLSKKCLVLDLDNTLWGGVVGDDGLDGIVLGPGTGAGEAHLSLQRYAKQLKERGIILAVCSKNDSNLAASVFRDHPEMILRRSDITAFVVNWEDKAQNLARIARDLNIGLDSLVFVDDNPVERARIRESLPEVSVPELPDDPTYYVRCIARAGYFEAISFTVEDRRRAVDYAANAERAALRVSSQSLDDFLGGLQMSMTFGPFAPVDLARVAQLVNKTNQFNPTTRRYSADELAALAAAPENVTLQFRLADRFCDNGLISAIILRPDPENERVLDIDTWVMSCRVFGRQVEAEALAVTVETARLGKVRMFRASYIPTPRNAVVAKLFPSLGFAETGGPRKPDGITHWSLNLAQFTPLRTRIARRPV
jgi:FkbH-like protein